MISSIETTARKANASIYHLKVVLLGSKPPVWRRLQVPGDAKLDWLHAVLQVAIGWTNSHLHQFRVGGDCYSDTRHNFAEYEGDPEILEARKFALRQIAPYEMDAFGYEYDFGDSWEHEITVEKILPPDAAAATTALCLDGTRACPPEDCGGGCVGLTRSTIERTGKVEIVEAAEWVLKAHPASKIEREPKPTRRVEDEEIVEFLIGEGLRIAAAEELTTTFRRIRRFANYCFQHPSGWKHIREHETRTFLIVPLLLALGWPEQAIKIEQPTKGGRVDLALFDGPFAGNPSECRALIETKGFAQGLSYAPDQARNYAKHFPKGRVIFVSNGYCYKAYRRTKDGFSSEPSAYLNIRDPRDAYPLNPKIPGALEVLRMLLKTT